MKLKTALVLLVAVFSVSAHAEVTTPNDPDYCQRIGQLSENLTAVAKKYNQPVDKMFEAIQAGSKKKGLDPQEIANLDMAHDYLLESQKHGETRTPAQICQEDTDIMNSIQPYDPEKDKE